MEQHEIESLQKLTDSAGWKILKKELEEEIRDMENELFKIKGKQGNEMVYSEHDLLRGERSIYVTLLETPTELIESFNSFETTEDDS